MSHEDRHLWLFRFAAACTFGGALLALVADDSLSWAAADLSALVTLFAFGRLWRLGRIRRRHTDRRQLPAFLLAPQNATATIFLA